MGGSRELASFGGFICRSIDRIVACLDGLSDADAAWRPPAPQASSLLVLANHTMGNAEENILETLCGQPVGRQREDEFDGAALTPAAMRARWQSLRPRLEAALAALPPADLDQERRHPRRGTIAGRDVLIVVARHAAEHMGQAELTRDLLNQHLTKDYNSR